MDSRLGHLVRYALHDGATAVLGNDNVDEVKLERLVDSRNVFFWLPQHLASPSRRRYCSCLRAPHMDVCALQGVLTV